MAKLGSIASYSNARRRWALLLSQARTPAYQRRAGYVVLFPVGGRASQPDQQRQGLSTDWQWRWRSCEASPPKATFGGVGH